VILSLALAAAVLLAAAGWQAARWLRVQARVRQARIAATKADEAMLAMALDLFAQDAGRYPTTAEGLAALVQPPPGVSKWSGPYLKKVTADPWGAAYTYSEAGGRYRVASAGPDGKPATGDDIVVAGPTPQPAR
jgi:general secretion pathway protein G